MQCHNCPKDPLCLAANLLDLGTAYSGDLNDTKERPEYCFGYKPMVAKASVSVTYDIITKKKKKVSSDHGTI